MCDTHLEEKLYILELLDHVIDVDALGEVAPREVGEEVVGGVQGHRRAEARLLEGAPGVPEHDSHEDVEEQVQLVERLFLEERHHTVLLFDYDTGHVCDKFSDANVNDLFLGLLLEPKVRIFFFTENSTINFAQILVAIERTIPSQGKVCKFNPAVLQEWSLKLRNVIG